MTRRAALFGVGAERLLQFVEGVLQLLQSIADAPAPLQAGAQGRQAWSALAFAVLSRPRRSATLMPVRRSRLPAAVSPAQRRCLRCRSIRSNRALASVPVCASRASRAPTWSTAVSMVLWSSGLPPPIPRPVYPQEVRQLALAMADRGAPAGAIRRAGKEACGHEVGSKKWSRVFSA